MSATSDITQQMIDAAKAKINSLSATVEQLTSASSETDELSNVITSLKSNLVSLDDSKERIKRKIVFLRTNLSGLLEDIESANYSVIGEKINKIIDDISGIEQSDIDNLSTIVGEINSLLDGVDNEGDNAGSSGNESGSTGAGDETVQPVPAPAAATGFIPGFLSGPNAFGTTGGYKYKKSRKHGKNKKLTIKRKLNKLKLKKTVKSHK